ncbi:WecB/TagA/CpsF family glycosyltransferase [Nesterenkonia alba]|uniref:WecB/TagA/CpsF family glycosyltransferase n=1 Tax=Nesterenkonia alba TaxID=515814 RepID=UPI000A01B6B3|nr:WecB/TagA/CpsF family glycosyltransferase [Nesterenkonia alba]
MTASETVQWVSQQTGKRLLLNHNLHSAYIYQKSQKFREVYEQADRVVIDGAPILWLARRNSHQELKTVNRIGSTDWIARLAESPRPGRLFVYGATEASNRDAVAKLREELGAQGWQVEGKHGYVDHNEAVAWLCTGNPSLVLVGLGMPRQEEFLHAAWGELPEAVYATVGGAIDYVAGHSTLAPRWVGRIGAEWIWRLVHDPRRLASRYLVEPVKLVGLIVRSKRNEI